MKKRLTTLLIIAAIFFLSVILHNLVSGLLGIEEPIFFTIALLSVIALLVYLVYVIFLVVIRYLHEKY